MKQTILVTGGTGFIGSHTTVELQEAGYEVVIIDNLSNSNANVVDGIEKITGIRPAFEAAKWMIPSIFGYFLNTPSSASKSQQSTCSKAGFTPVIFSMPSSTLIFEFERLSMMTTS